VSRKRCLVAYALPSRQDLWPVELEGSATVADALAQTRAASGREDVPWDEAPVGIFGEPCGRDVVPLDGDRIEIYRPLGFDPRETRRERAKRLRQQGRAGRPPAR
jgi:putative ubiquitin-RnfH superfamily antitoxin RatB of RatAB toxin-antitoxin module